MVSLVPPLRALLQRLVVARLVLLDQSFQADVTAYRVAQMVALQQQPGHPAVAIPERMNAQKIEVKGGQSDQGVYPGFVETSLPVADQFQHRSRSFGGGYGAKTNALAAVRMSFDDIAVPLFVLAGIPDFPSGQPMQTTDRFFGNR